MKSLKGYMWLKQIYPLKRQGNNNDSDDDVCGTIPGKAYHFSVSESTRYAYYVGCQRLHDGRQLHALRVIDTWRGTIMLV
ncbi:hypothetical protein OESDEN_09370 [Oesophagostomum dentatum]|uniref:Uncharacterized protein n=1 Tax=Oesophagostomum dentatum TaxID=61180 RepID=A0A0B1T3Q5_OESDE|nr:hypothetical protein OESDEN_09370 [Oesophagostomum dentatum]